MTHACCMQLILAAFVCLQLLLCGSAVRSALSAGAVMLRVLTCIMYRHAHLRMYQCVTAFKDHGYLQ